jgi:hypothetical protein
LFGFRQSMPPGFEFIREFNLPCHVSI